MLYHFTRIAAAIDIVRSGVLKGDFAPECESQVPGVHFIYEKSGMSKLDNYMAGEGVVFVLTPKLLNAENYHAKQARDRIVDQNTMFPWEFREFVAAEDESDTRSEVTFHDPISIANVVAIVSAVPRFRHMLREVSRSAIPIVHSFEEVHYCPDPISPEIPTLPSFLFARRYTAGLSLVIWLFRTTEGCRAVDSYDTYTLSEFKPIFEARYHFPLPSC